jgi:hypothetical protein
MSCGSGSAGVPTLGVWSKEMGGVCDGGDAYMGGGVGPCAWYPASIRLSLAKRLHSLRILIWIEIYAKSKLDWLYPKAEAKERHLR